MHQMGYIHRDLKPANIMLGYGKRENNVYLIDFGLVKKTTECTFAGFSNNGKFMPKKLAGTPIYAPLNAHLLTGGILYS